MSWLEFYRFFSYYVKNIPSYLQWYRTFDRNLYIINPQDESDIIAFPTRAKVLGDYLPIVSDALYAILPNVPRGIFLDELQIRLLIKNDQINKKVDRENFQLAQHACNVAFTYKAGQLAIKQHRDPEVIAKIREIRQNITDAQWLVRAHIGISLVSLAILSVAAYKGYSSINFIKSLPTKAYNRVADALKKLSVFIPDGGGPDGDGPVDPSPF